MCNTWLQVSPSRTSPCLPSACRGPFSASLVASSPGPALPLPLGCIDKPDSHLTTSNLSGLSFCPGPASLCRPKLFCSQSSVGSPSASWWPAHTQLRLQNRLNGSRTCIAGASPGLALTSRPLPRSRILPACLPAASTGPAPPAPGPVSTQLMPLAARQEV